MCWCWLYNTSKLLSRGCGTLLYGHKVELIFVMTMFHIFQSLVKYFLTMCLTLFVHVAKTAIRFIFVPVYYLVNVFSHDI